ncbi:UDP-glycosyltransferase 88B1 [Triticum aestivum]|uniref:UDP-glycosyltransferase 88B1 n=1 Tax=Triticum aestivum TaxID=4565 RepID=UPI001D031C8B|nr:UDP-glycosyltransferase 88B1-like [Triticum aestivum]
MSVSVTVKQKTVVLYPSLGVGHLNPMVELANVFLRRGQAIAIAVVNPPDKGAVSEDAMARLSTANPAITFRLLPVPSCGKDHYSHPVLRTTDVLRAANPSLRGFLRTLPAVDAIVVDMFCVDALDVAAELDIPAYFFFASAVGDLAIMLHLPYYYPAAPCSFKDMGKTVLRFPGVPPIRALDMSTTMLDQESDIAKEWLRHHMRMPEARGFLANSFDWLEARALEALRGFVVKNWAPQAEVLRHGAVGAFVTHCGWNSRLEGIVSGVPMICWPLYAEQRMNKVHVVEEMKVGMAVEGYEEGLVKAEEVAAKVRLVMASEEGNKLRERLVAAKETAVAAVKDGGSSDVAFHEFFFFIISTDTSSHIHAHTLISMNAHAHILPLRAPSRD